MTAEKPVPVNSLRVVRKAANMTQHQLSEAMGRTQATGLLSRMEHQTDYKMSTMLAYLEGCGAVEVELRFTLNGRPHALSLPLPEGAS